MNISAIILLVLLVCVIVYELMQDFKLMKRIMKNDKNDSQFKNDFKKILDKKTKLYYTIEDLTEIPVNPFEYKKREINIIL